MNMTLSQMSFSGSLIILMIIVIRAIIKHRVSKKILLILWGIANLRLLCPFSIPSAYSIYSLFNQNINIHEILIETPIMSSIPMNSTKEMVMNNEMTYYFNQRCISIFSIIWFIGFFILITFFVVAYLKCHLEFQNSINVNNVFIYRWLQEHQIKRSIKIRQCSHITSPLTYGIFHPVILLPEDIHWENKKQLEYILYHEFIHICHFDMIIKIILSLVVCIHWFNPIVWIMYVLFNRDIEMICDECVIKHFGYSARSDYANTLISMVESKNVFTVFSHHFSKNAIEERIISIMKTNKRTNKAVTVCIVIFLIIILPFMTSAENKEVHGSVKSNDKEDITYQLTLKGVMERILQTKELDQALDYNQEVDNIRLDNIVLLCKSENAKYEAYGFISPEYGKRGILINNIINGEDNWNYLEEDWEFSQDKPMLKAQGNYEVIFTFTQKNQVRTMNFETYDTGTMVIKKI